jgi:hypothetical protein
MTPEECHREAAKIASSIILPTLQAGGDFIEILQKLELVIVGTVLFGVKEGGDEAVLDLLFKHVKQQIAECREANRATIN